MTVDPHTSPTRDAVKNALITLVDAGWNVNTGICAGNPQAVRISIRSPDIEVQPEQDLNTLIDILMGNRMPDEE